MTCGRGTLGSLPIPLTMERYCVKVRQNRTFLAHQGLSKTAIEKAVLDRSKGKVTSNNMASLITYALRPPTYALKRPTFALILLAASHHHTPLELRIWMRKNSGGVLCSYLTCD